MRHVAVMAVLALLTSGPAFAAHPGLWEYRTTTEIPGLDSQQVAGTPLGQLVGPHSFSSCIAANGVPRQPPGTGQCTVTNIVSDGTTVTWHADCRNEQGSLTGDGSARYSGDRMSSRMDMTGDVGGFPIAVSVTAAGAYRGECPAR